MAPYKNIDSTFLSCVRRDVVDPYDNDEDYDMIFIIVSRLIRV